MKNQLNSIFYIHETLACLASMFRNRVCEECNYSMPTFYRKMRNVDVTDENGKIILALSNAEKDKIWEVAKEVRDFLIRHLEEEQDKQNGAQELVRHDLTM